MIRRPPRSTRKESSAASDVYKRQCVVVVNLPLIFAVEWLICRRGRVCVRSMSERCRVRRRLRALHLHLSFTVHRLPVRTKYVDRLSRLVLPFWYGLTWVVLDKGSFNGCVCVVGQLGSPAQMRRMNLLLVLILLPVRRKHVDNTPSSNSLSSARLL